MDQPWFRFYAADYLLDPAVQKLPPEAISLLIRMWCVCWIEGSCPDDPDELAVLTRCKPQYVRQCKPHCQPLFDLQDGRLYSHRMERERRKSEQARVNAEKRYKQKGYEIGSANGIADGSANGSPHSHCHSQSQGQGQNQTQDSDINHISIHPLRPPQKIITPEYSAEFLQFWTAYPNKVKKAKAWKAWIKLKPENGLLVIIIGSVNLHKKTSQWCKSEGQYIPNPEAFLNGRRWEDEISTKDLEWEFQHEGE